MCDINLASQIGNGRQDFDVVGCDRQCGQLGSHLIASDIARGEYISDGDCDRVLQAAGPIALAMIATVTSGSNPAPSAHLRRGVRCEAGALRWAPRDLVEASKEYHALIMEAIEGRIVPRSDIRDAFEKLATAHDAWVKAANTPAAPDSER
jgi:hypothetical protein